MWAILAAGFGLIAGVVTTQIKIGIDLARDPYLKAAVEVCREKHVTGCAGPLIDGLGLLVWIVSTALGLFFTRSRWRRAAPWHPQHPASDPHDRTHVENP